MTKFFENNKKRMSEVIDLDGNIGSLPETYLDSTATGLINPHVMEESLNFANESLANTHTKVSNSGAGATLALSDARAAVGKFLGYDPQKDVVIFNGFGATGPLNYLSQVIFPKELRYFNDANIPLELRNVLLDKLPSEKKKEIAKEMMDKPVVITTEMEHHSNQITWYDDNVKIVPIDKITGELDLGVLKQLLEENKGKVRLVTLSGASNVTGITSDIYEIAKIVHEAGAEICVDAAQLAPHKKIEKRRTDPNESLDYIVTSPHKFGAPGPGVIVANRSLIEKRRNLASLGGGVVNTVSAYPPEYTPIDDLAEGEEPGTPSIFGAVAVGLAADYLTRNMDKLEEKEKQLTKSLITNLKEKLGDEIEIIGDSDLDKRVGVVSFTIKDIPHPIVASFLNDHWNVSVRNGCFCAHPLIIKMSGVEGEEMEKIKAGDRSAMPGYVRASLGEHNTQEDINTIVKALEQLVQNKDKVLGLYSIDKGGNATREDGFKANPRWSFEEAAERIVARVAARENGELSVANNNNVQLVQEEAPVKKGNPGNLLNEVNSSIRVSDLIKKFEEISRK